MGVCSSSHDKPPVCTASLKRKSWARYVLGHRSASAIRDCERYRNGYPDIVEGPDSATQNKNELFFLNRIPSASKDGGALIDTIHREWWNDHKKLEQKHDYIQCLFPLREPGLNPEQLPLTLREIEVIKSKPECQKRLLTSYDMMLHFYGMKRIDEAGTIVRDENWEKRYRNLISHPHNFLRITRICKSLGELGQEHLKKPLIDHLYQEIFEGDAPLRDMGESFVNYMMEVLRDKKEREDVERQVHRYANLGTGME